MRPPAGQTFTDMKQPLNNTQTERWRVVFFFFLIFFGCSASLTYGIEDERKMFYFTFFLPHQRHVLRWLVKCKYEQQERAYIHFPSDKWQTHEKCLSKVRKTDWKWWKRKRLRIFELFELDPKINSQIFFLLCCLCTLFTCVTGSLSRSSACCLAQTIFNLIMRLDQQLSCDPWVFEKWTNVQRLTEMKSNMKGIWEWEHEKTFK